MHQKLLLLAAAAMALLVQPAQAFWDWNQVPPFEGNDTGGIIAWSPAIRYTYRDMAAEHCARYNKVARITSVHAHYGDYVGFICHWPRGYDPVKALYEHAVPVYK